MTTAEDTLLKALRAAAQIIRDWHGLHFPTSLPEIEATTWKIYWEHGPEMLPIRAALGNDLTKAPTITGPTGPTGPGERGTPGELG